MHRKSVVGVLAAGLTALLVAGCAGQSTPAPTTPAPGNVTAAPSSEHNAADVTFAQDMIPHHQQAVAMAALAADHAGNDQVKQLAARIRDAQDPEITQMQGLLSTWGAPASGGMGTMPGMSDDHGADHSGGMPGMVADDDLGRLGHATGT